MEIKILGLNCSMFLSRRNLVMMILSINFIFLKRMTNYFWTSFVRYMFTNTRIILRRLLTLNASFLLHSPLMSTLRVSYHLDLRIFSMLLSKVLMYFPLSYHLFYVGSSFWCWLYSSILVSGQCNNTWEFHSILYQYSSWCFSF